jgi:hypothetical protein
VAADRSKPRGNVREGGRAVPDEVVGLSSQRQLSASARPGRTGRAEWGPCLAEDRKVDLRPQVARVVVGQPAVQRLNFVEVCHHVRAAQCRRHGGGTGAIGAAPVRNFSGPVREWSLATCRSRAAVDPSRSPAPSTTPRSCLPAAQIPARRLLWSAAAGARRWGCPARRQPRWRRRRRAAS